MGSMDLQPEYEGMYQSQYSHVTRNTSKYDFPCKYYRQSGYPWSVLGNL